jgi:hypothetical protein
MRSSESRISCFSSGVALFLAMGLAGCGDFCITGFSINGTGQIHVSAGNPPPPCSLPHVNTMMRAVAIKSTACKDCSAAARVEHLFVTLQGIELRRDAAGEATSAAWIEIAPQFAAKPRQIDLIGNSPPELLEENVLVPAGNYREVRLKLFSGSSVNVCGSNAWNCLVMADGRVQELALPNEDSELLLAFDAERGSFLVPDSKVELQLHLEPRQVFHASPSGGWKQQMILAGKVSIKPETTQAERTTPEM